MRDLGGDHRLMSLNTATVRKQGSLLDIIEACARHGIRAIDPWRDQIAATGIDRAAKAIRDAGLQLSGYCRGGMFTADAGHRIEARDDNRRAVDEAKTLGAPCLVLVAGGLPQYSRPGSTPSKDIAAAHAQVEDGIAELFEYSRSAGVALAIEPLHPMTAADRACVNTMRQALDLCDRIDPARNGMLGVAVDVYHVWWDFELMAQIERAGPRRLLAFHVCDWLVPTADTVNDRGMPGDGIIDIPRIRAAVEGQGFGAREVYEAEDGAAGLEAFTHYIPDIVITDWAMPIFDGLELMQMIRQPGANANPYVAIIMLTGHSEKKRVMAARDAGVTEFLAKPISAKALYQRIINVVANPRPFIKTKTYFGPDRRRNTASNYIGPERRKGGKADIIRQTPLLEKARAPV